MRKLRPWRTIERLRSLCAPALLLGLLILSGLVFSACSTRQQGLQPTPGTEPDGESPDLAIARRMVDRGIAILDANRDKPWSEVQPALMEVMRSEPTPYLDDTELEALKGYLEQHRSRLQPIIDRMNETRPKTTASAQANECVSYCVLFFLLECETDCPIGGCLGFWDCDDGVTFPDCDECVDEADSPCTKDEDCPDGYRCAKWVFKKNECVLPCDDDDDCPSGEECKRPFGTRFKRCK